MLVSRMFIAWVSYISSNGGGTNMYANWSKRRLYFNTGTLMSLWTDKIENFHSLNSDRYRNRHAQRNSHTRAAGIR